MAAYSRLKSLLLWIACLGLLLLIPLGLEWKLNRDSRDSYAVYHEAVVVMKNHGWPNSWSTEQGFWTGDVTELYRRGFISKALAEADAAPIQSLVPRPRPFHGYLIVAMNTGPGWHGTPPAPLKKQNWYRGEFAYCIFPAERGRPELPVYLVCSFGIFRKASDEHTPYLDWPAERTGWSIVD